MTIIAYIITFLLFLGPVVLSLLGWPVEGDITGAHRLYPSYYILLITLSLLYFKGHLSVKKCKYAITIVAVIALWYIGNKFFGKEPSKMVLINSMAIPVMYYIFWKVYYTKRKNNKGILNIILIMYLVNSILAIYERYSYKLFFPYDLIRSDMGFMDIDDYAVFRSSALLGHPLSNALLMSIIMVYILTSTLKPKTKYLLWIIGFVGLLCFNARAAILFSGLVFIIYISKSFFDKSSLKNKITSFLILLISATIITYLFKVGLGGRFEALGQFSQDSSALARVNVLDIFERYGITMFLWGGADAENIAMLVMGSSHIENWFILSSMVAGVILTVIVIALFVPLFIDALRPYCRFASILILIIVLGLSSTNNSLACGVQALPLFFTCSYAFKKHNNIKTVDCYK